MPKQMLAKRSTMDLELLTKYRTGHCRQRWQRLEILYMAQQHHTNKSGFRHSYQNWTRLDPWPVWLKNWIRSDQQSDATKFNQLVFCEPKESASPTEISKFWSALKMSKTPFLCYLQIISPGIHLECSQ